MKFRRKKGAPPRYIEITALIDVMFILNIFFMLNSQSFTPTGIQVSLPEGKTSERILLKSLEIVLNDLDQIAINDSTLTQKELRSALGTHSREVPIILKADQEASYGKALSVVDLLREMKFLYVTFATVPQRI